MSLTVCLLTKNLTYPQGGGLLWAYLNWALGLQAVGCDVIWMEVVDSVDRRDLPGRVQYLQQMLARYGLSERIALCSSKGRVADVPLPPSTVDFDAAADADLLVNMAYDKIGAPAVARFRRSAFIDIDPGLTQIWMAERHISVAPHDVFITIGEGIGRPGALVPDGDIAWHHVPPPVFVPAWPVSVAAPGAAYTTVTHWGIEGLLFQGRDVPNGKREGFLPFIDLPRHTSATLELAVFLEKYEGDGDALRKQGWRIRDPHSVAGTPWDYQDYVQKSRGEFSCAKPGYVLLQNAWISDRTLCYLSSGKPAIVQHTGPSSFLPDAEGLFRFSSVVDAANALDIVEADYERHSRAARSLAEEHFDAVKVARRVLEIALA